MCRKITVIKKNVITMVVPGILFIFLSVIQISNIEVESIIVLILTLLLVLSVFGGLFVTLSDKTEKNDDYSREKMNYAGSLALEITIIASLLTSLIGSIMHCQISLVGIGELIAGIGLLSNGLFFMIVMRGDGEGCEDEDKRISQRKRNEPNRTS